MPVEIHEKLTVVVRHHTDDRVRGNAIVSRYKPGSEPRLVVRPDGNERNAIRLRCRVCRESLEYQLHSAGSTARRQTRWLWLTWAGVALVGLGVLLIASLAGSDAGEIDTGTYLTVTAGLLTILAGIFCTVVFGNLRAHDDGMTGHNRSLPGVTKHAVTADPTSD